MLKHIHFPLTLLAPYIFIRHCYASKDFEASQRSVKINIYFNFLPSFEIQTRRVKNKELQADAFIFFCFKLFLHFTKPPVHTRYSGDKSHIISLNSITLFLKLY